MFGKRRPRLLERPRYPDADEPLIDDPTKIVGEILTILRPRVRTGMPYAELIAKLTEIEYRPWLDRTRPRLSAILTPLGIEKQQWHIGSNHVRWATR
jgi:hypothetical protein